MNFGIELVDSQNYEVSFFSNVIKNIFWNLRNVIKNIFWNLRGDLFLNKFYTERSPMSFKFVLGVGT